MPHELDETWQLLDDFAGAVRLLQVEGHRDGDVLPVLCELALKIVGGDHASVTTIRDARFTTVEATSDLPERADQIPVEVQQLSPDQATVKPLRLPRADGVASRA
jgi:hypothetical protein